MSKRRVLAALGVLLLVPVIARGETERVYRLVDAQGSYLTSICVEPSAGDEYLAGDDRLYRVETVDGNTAIARFVETLALPDVSWLDADAAQAVFAPAAARKLAFYCTHSDESFEPTDGTYSKTDRGSIYDVAHALAAALEKQGVDTTVSDATHHPHDAGAYKRSRQTAVQLLKEGPDAIFDIHRDGIPDPDQYAVTIGTKKASKVRLLVGRSNEFMDANKEFALMVKAVGDKVYPGLIKDIYMGKGTYNQDLHHKALLLECGTYTLDKERVLTSMPLMADVISRAMYGGVVGSAGASDVGGSSSAAAKAEKGGVTEGAADSDKGSGSGLWWLLGITLAAVLVYAFVQTGSAKGMIHKLARNASEVTGGLIGKKPEKGDKPGQE